MPKTNTIDRAAWERLARETPNRFDDDAFDLLGWEKRDDDLTTTMLGIALAASEEAARGGDYERSHGLMEIHDRFLSYWAPVRALRQRVGGEHITGDWETVQALCRVVLEQEDRIAVIEARLAES